MNDTTLVPDAPRHDATATDTPPVIIPDIPRSVATVPDIPRHDVLRDFSLTLDEVAARFEREGLARSMRTLQRYCASGRLDCLKTDTVAGEQYFVDPHSVDRAITELKQLSALTQRRPTGDDSARHVAAERVTSYAAEYSPQTPTPHVEQRHDATRHDMARPVADGLKDDRPGDSQRQPPTPAPTPRHDATVDTFMSRYVERIESENVFLREQVDRKDQQIGALLERDKETNFLVRGLQQMLTPLLGNPTRRNDEETPFGQMR